MAVIFYSEFTEDLDLLDKRSTPSLKQVNLQYRKIALVKHPDKGGEKESFQALSQSYLKLSTFLANLEDTEIDSNDTEENELKQFFQKYNVIIENTGSTTIMLENGRETEWRLC